MQTVLKHYHVGVTKDERAGESPYQARTLPSTSVNTKSSSCKPTKPSLTCGTTHAPAQKCSQQVNMMYGQKKIKHNTLPTIIYTRDGSNSSKQHTEVR